MDGEAFRDKVSIKWIEVLYKQVRSSKILVHYKNINAVGVYRKSEACDS